MATPTLSNDHSFVNGIQKYTSPSIWRPTEIRNAPKRDAFSFDTMEDALNAFKAGEFLVVMDDESRENEGDLIISAAHCTTEKMAWMIKHTRYVFLRTSSLFFKDKIRLVFVNVYANTYLRL